MKRLLWENQLARAEAFTIRDLNRDVCIELIVLKESFGAVHATTMRCPVVTRPPKRERKRFESRVYELDEQLVI